MKNPRSTAAAALLAACCAAAPASAQKNSDIEKLHELVRQARAELQALRVRTGVAGEESEGRRGKKEDARLSDDVVQRIWPVWIASEVDWKKVIEKLGEATDVDTEKGTYRHCDQHVEGSFSGSNAGVVGEKRKERDLDAGVMKDAGRGKE